MDEKHPRGGETVPTGSLYDAETPEEIRRRYGLLAEGLSWKGGFPAEFAPERGNLRFFSAPGRTELGGNHTDHNRGRMLAAAVHLDMAAAVAARDDRLVFLRSAGFPDTVVDLGGGKTGLSPRPEERGTAAALVRGVAAGFAARGVAVGGFAANVSSRVPLGSGLSSSAALETLLGRIFDGLYCPGRFSPMELARIGMEAENVFFGKPCGLMDQAACAHGGTVAMDFSACSSSGDPAAESVAFDPAAAGFALCVVDTGGNHADLTQDYAAILAEMGEVARFFGKSLLCDLDLSRVLAHAPAIRRAAGDRALLRAVHFFGENRRVAQMAALLDESGAAKDPAEKRHVMERFLDAVNESGHSSWELLQNVYSPGTPGRQGLSLALAASVEYFRETGAKAACRVHGGGFAGTVQAYVPAEALDGYRARMEALFGPGSLTVLRIRSAGAVEVNPEGG